MFATGYNSLAPFSFPNCVWVPLSGVNSVPLNPAHATRLSGCRRFLADDGWLRKVVLGYYQYHAVPGNTTQLRIFKIRVCRLWQSVLVRRSQRTKMCWARFTPVLNRWIPPPRVLHPIPMHASTPPILRKSRMRRRARTDLGGGESAMVVPTATVGAGGTGGLNRLQRHASPNSY